MPLAQTLAFEVQDYFMHLNPIAERIASDIRDTKLAYGIHLWYTLQPHQQNAIINDALIKPEISLKYFEQFSAASSSSSLVKTVSADSLAAVVLKNLNIDEKTNQTQNQQRQDNINTSGPKRKNIDYNQCYDGYNLQTFALQKVALKVIHDEAFGTYRDEHSKPFSFRTKSQINFHLVDQFDCIEKTQQIYMDYNIRELKEKMLTKKSNESSIQASKGVQSELKSTAFVDAPNIANELASVETNLKISNELPLTVIKLNNPQKKSTPPLKTTDNFRKNKILKASDSIKMFIPVSYTDYTDSLIDHGEYSNLMHYNNDTFTGCSSSATTSEDDENNDDETLCEDVKLLDNDNSLRKGFDFLNNW